MAIAIAVIMACHDRKKNTLDCLRALSSQMLPPDVSLHVYLMDDGSTDGTSEAVREAFPQVTMLEGDGSHFWNGGMRVAFAEAMNIGGYSYYVWVNDDTTLCDSAIAKLLRTHAELTVADHGDCIVVGATQDPVTAQWTYGGVTRVSMLNRIRFRLVEPYPDNPRRCDTLNGNCVLIPGAIATRLGNLSPHFTHAMGDFDYGLRAEAQGIQTWLAPGIVGACAKNLRVGSWQDTTLPVGVRYKKLLGVKGLPVRDWLHFCRSHAGWLWPLIFASPYVKLIISSLWANVDPADRKGAQ